MNRNSSQQQILTAQLGLLYANAGLGAGITILAASILGFLQWGLVAKPVVIAWWFYMAAISVVRLSFARRGRAQPKTADVGSLRTAFSVGVGLTGAGWGAAGILLYPAAPLTNQVFLIFVIGGMMLGSSSLLAPRPEAYLSYLIPAGLGPAIRLFVQGDQTHVAMGLLASVFTLATVITTGRIFRMMQSSLRLQIENRDLVENLQAANQQTEALNQALELRVQQRTAELHQSTQALRAEIAQREQAEEELLRARKLESVGVLAGGIAHDFNNFLTVVHGNIEVAKAQIMAGEPAQEFLDHAASACQRAKFLSSQLLTFAKGGAPVRRVVSIAELVTDAVQLARTGSPVNIEVKVAEGLWSAEVDPGQIGQVLHNILLNARQAMPGSGTIEVGVVNLLEKDAVPLVRISIRDHGPGMSPEVAARIFDPYFTTKPGGTGLGLATAYSIVVKHGGHITVDSTPGAGTVFTVDLRASLETPQAQVPNVVAVQHGTERLLVMDDEETLLILFKAVLSKLGYDVQTARDGAEAIALYQAGQGAGKPFDAVLLDLTVTGGMGGMEAAVKLKELDPAVKLIVSSGYSEAPVMSGFAEYGFDAVVLKPWTVKEISDVLRRVLTTDSPG